MQRRLAAILVADIVGYSAMMEQAEEQTAGTLAHAKPLSPQRLRHTTAG
jgi:adenylate cyclase